MPEKGENLPASEADLLTAFRAYESGIALANARLAAVFAAVFMLAASSLDWIIIPEHGSDFLLIRAVCGLLGGAIFWYLDGA